MTIGNYRIYGALGAIILGVACSDSAVAPIIDGSDPVLANLGTMQVGDVRTMTLAAASGGLTIPADLASAQYAVILGNVNITSNTAADYTVRGDWLAPAASTPVSDVFPPIQRPLVAPPSIPLGEQFESRLRHFERSGLPHPGGSSSGRRGASATQLVPRAVAAIVPEVGSSIPINVLTADGFDGVTTSSCAADAYVKTRGTVRYVSQHAIIVSDVNSPPGGFGDADFKAIGDEFDDLIYPTDVGYFGAPTDLDGNGHIFIYYTPAVNKLTPAGQAETTGYVGGFFFAGDLYQPTPDGCIASNEGEIFYLLAPDPGGVNGNSFTTTFVRQITRGTVAHEFQHMINSGKRFQSTVATSFEATWLDEGLAHFAEDAVGRAKAGFADNYTARYNDIRDLDTTITQAFFLQNFARAKYYVERPDTTAAIVNQSRAASSLASRGAEWALVRYVADWFNGNGDPRTLTRALVAGPDTGSVNLVKATGVSMDTILARFTVTLYADHQAFVPLSAPYHYKSYYFRDLVSGILIGNESAAKYLPIMAVGNGTTTVSAKVPASSGAYFLTSLTTGSSRTISITDSGGDASTDPDGRVYIVRTK
jgi:hypothetical protein